MVELKHISIGSAAKVGAIAYALFFSVFGLIYLAFVGVFFSMIGNLARSSAQGGNFGTFGIASLCIGYIVGIVIAFIGGGIGGALAAFVYNLTARWVGGLELHLNVIPPASNAPAPLP